MDTKQWMSDFIDTESDAKVGMMIGLVLEELLSRQTEAEKASETTKEQNTVGFTAFDAKSGTQDAQAFKKYGSLAGFRLERWARKDKNGSPRIAKYHGQVDQEALSAKLADFIPSPVTAEGKLAEARQEYARVRGLFDTASDCDPRKFDEMVKAKVGENPTPERFVEVAKRMRVPCRRCAGTGQYVTMVVNGRPTGPGGICFRCEGKGVQTLADARRNWGYDRFGRKVYL